jgi:hypothetical protein
MRRKLGERGVREARKRYDIRNIAGQWEELINRYGVSPARQKPGA